MVRAAILENQVGAPQPASALRTIRLDPYFQDLLPLPSKEERSRLADSVFRDGVAEPLIVWLWKDRRILIVGYELYPILQRYVLPFRLVEKEFRHREAARLFVISYLTSQRLATPLHMSYLRGLYYLSQRRGHGGDRRSDKAKTQGQTGEAIAEMFGVSRATLLRDVQFAEALDGLAEQSSKDVIPHLLAKATRGRVFALKRLPAAEQKRMLKAFMFSGRMSRQVRGALTHTITLTRDPEKMIDEIKERLGEEWIIKLREILNRTSPAPT